MIEFSHVLCGSFRLTESQRLPRRIVTVLNGGLILGEEDESEPGGMWRCQLVPDAFAAATKGGLPGQGSAANYSFDREQYKREITDGNGSTVLPLHDICVWPGSEAACTLMEKLVDHGLVLRDAPLECKSCFVESFLKALPEDEERVQLFDPKSQSPLHFKAFHNEGWEVKAENGVLRVHHYDNPEAELWMGKDFVVHTSAKDAINGFQRIGFIIEKDKPIQEISEAEIGVELDKRGIKYEPQNCDTWGPIEEDEALTEADRYNPEAVQMLDEDSDGNLRARFVKYPHLDDPAEQAYIESLWAIQRATEPPLSSWDERVDIPLPWEGPPQDLRAGVNKEIMEQFKQERELWKKATVQARKDAEILGDRSRGTARRNK
mmetsp:Transcript_42256/g.66186  ORF Transcript_42256/g.66186 Transcript_42256/m.66186 type:complete len:377 (+) Transcript_42256:831-1961(+)